MLPEGVAKEVLQAAPAGDGGRPGHGDECRVCWVGRLQGSAEEFDSSEERGEPTVFALGSGQVVRGWDIGVATMARGERARFTLAPEFAYGEQGAPPKVPGDATLVYDITLLDWRSGADIFGDGGAIRSTLQAGMGLHMPVQGSAVLCSLKVSTAGGEVLDDQDVMEYTLGSGELGPLSRTVDTVLQDMRTGGKVRLELSGQYAWGDGTYLVELGLKEVVQVEDISPAGDGSLRKKRVLRGRGDDPPRDCDLVTLTVEAATTHVPSGRGELSFRIGDGDVADGFELVAARMLPGEVAVLISASAALCAEPRLGLEGLASEKGEVSLMVALAGCERAGAPADPAALAASRKEVGGRHFGAQRFGLALGRYQAAAALAAASSGEASAELARVCRLNEAACLLKLEAFCGAAAACTAVLREDPSCVKALFRRATARLALGEPRAAAEDAARLAELDAGSLEAQRLLARATQAASADERRSAEVARGMARALDGSAAEAEARRQHEERHRKGPGQVLSVAEQEEAWEKAVRAAEADLRRARGGGACAEAAAPADGPAREP